MAMTIEFDDKEVREALASLLMKLGNLRPAFANIGEAMLRQIHLRFERGVDQDGNPWAPLAASTIARKGHGRPLIQQGERGGLLGSIHYQESDSDVVIGTNMVYAAVCQFGSKPHKIKPRDKRALHWPGLEHPVKEVNHPGTAPRPFLGIGENDKKKILGVVADFFELQD